MILRRIAALLLGTALIIILAACASKQEEKPSESEAATEESSSDETTETVEEKADVLVIYFSATGNTEGVAQQIAEITEADIYRILPAVPYTEEDLDYSDSETRATREQNDPDARPEIGSDDISLNGYKTVFLGYPIWWGQEPRIMDTFVEKYDFDGITVIPFCTSGSSGIGQTGSNLASLAQSGNWLEGRRFGAGAGMEEITEWINELNN